MILFNLIDPLCYHHPINDIPRNPTANWTSDINIDKVAVKKSLSSYPFPYLLDIVCVKYTK